jgi:hypothetical protein
MPKLKKIDLTKGKDHRNPEINADTPYLCKIDNEWYAGTFSSEWFGLSFNGWLGTPYQYDQPGTNHSDWQEVWEIVEE